jgi:hypothetical protein
MAKIEKADREQLLYIIAEEFGGDGKAWEQLAVEMVKAMSDTQAKEILGYIAKNWGIDTMGYEASAKKSKVVKSDKLTKIPLVDVNKDDIEISFNFASTGNESLYDGRMVFYTYASFMKGYDKDRFSGGGIRDIQVGRFEYPIAEALNPAIIEQMKEAGYQAVMNEIDDFIVDDDFISDYNPSGIVTNPGARFGNINGYSASTKKSKSFNEMIKEQRKQYKNKKVL